MNRELQDAGLRLLSDAEKLEREAEALEAEAKRLRGCAEDVFRACDLLDRQEQALAEIRSQIVNLPRSATADRINEVCRQAAEGAR